MSQTDTSPWTSHLIVRVAVVAAALGCIGPLALAVVRVGTHEVAPARRVTAAGRTAANPSLLASRGESLTPAERQQGSASPTRPADPAAPTATTVARPTATTTST